MSLQDNEKRRPLINGTWPSQDGGIGRHTVPPHTTKRRTTTNLKTTNNQNLQKIELYGSPTTKELKKKHSSRPVGDGTPGQRGRAARQRLEDQGGQGGSWWTWRGGRWQTGQSHIHLQVNREEQLGRRQT